MIQQKIQSSLYKTIQRLLISSAISFVLTALQREKNLIIIHKFNKDSFQRNIILSYYSKGIPARSYYASNLCVD